VSGFAFSIVANIFIFMILDDFCFCLHDFVIES
jgi:hypothetical protein